MFHPVKSDIFSIGVCALELKMKMIISDSSMSQMIEEIDCDTIEGDLLI